MNVRWGLFEQLMVRNTEESGSIAGHTCEIRPELPTRAAPQASWCFGAQQQTCKEIIRHPGRAESHSGASPQIIPSFTLEKQA